MNIKKQLLIVALILISIASFAQEQKIKEESKVLFKPHWFMQIQAGAAYTVGEAKFGDLISPAAALNFGYKFNPYLGLRFGASGWQARGGWSDLSYSYNFIQGNLDLMLDLSNTFSGFRHNRVFDAYLFAGIGGNYGFNNGANDITSTKHPIAYNWDTKGFFVGRFGLGGNFRASDRVSINIEANANLLSDKFNSKKGDNIDWHCNLLVGVGIKLGKGYTVTPPVYYDYQKPEEPKKEAAPAPKKEETPAPVVEAPVVEKVAALTENIFFKINTSNVSTEQMSKIDNLVQYLTKITDAKVIITGYADKATGTASVNKRISEKRAKSVSALLISRGISADRIIVNFKGDIVQPYNTIKENRVSICIAE